MRELDWWNEIQVNHALKITFVPAQHFSARGLFDQRKSLWGGYMIENRGRRLYFAGDTGYSTHFSDIRIRLGTPDIALLGIGSYEPRWFMKPIHMNPAEAVCASSGSGQQAKYRHAFWYIPANNRGNQADPRRDLKLALSESRIPENQFITLQEGETRSFPAD